MQKHHNHIQQLADYIKRNLNKGYTLDALKFSLMNQGYSKISVERAIEIANRQLAEKIPLMKEKPRITYKLIKDDGEKSEVIYVPLEKKRWWKRLFS